VAEIAGTIPPVKQRPKVAKRPTILAAAAVPASVAVPSKVAATCDHSETKPSKRTTAKALAELATQPRPRAARQRTVTAPTMPSVKERPKVTRQSKILTPSTGMAKKTPKPVVALHGAAPEKPAHPEKEKAAEADAPKGIRWTSWLPIAAGIAISSVAPQLFGLVGHWNPWGQRVLFPLVQLTGLHEIGMSDELTRTMPQLMLYLQFPLEGLLVASNLRRGQSLSRAFGPVPSLHFVCALVLWIVALGSMPMI